VFLGFCSVRKEPYYTPIKEEIKMTTEAWLAKKRQLLELNKGSDEVKQVKTLGLKRKNDVPKQVVKKVKKGQLNSSADVLEELYKDDDDNSEVEEEVVEEVAKEVMEKEVEKEVVKVAEKEVEEVVPQHHTQLF
jgi:RNA polymerase-interacting CarD/CdnL/TRCF family regulator